MDSGRKAREMWSDDGEPKLLDFSCFLPPVKWRLYHPVKEPRKDEKTI